MRIVKGRGVCPHCGDDLNYEWEKVISTNECAMDLVPIGCSNCDKEFYAHVEIVEFNVLTALTKREIWDRCDLAADEHITEPAER